jgi:predicted Zn-dependent protease
MTGHSPQDAVERALQAARCDDCVVIAAETSSANLRWAGNTLTTNGVARSRQLTVIAISRGRDGTSAGVVSRAGVSDEMVADVVAEAEHAAAQGSAAEDAGPLVTTAAAGPLAAAGSTAWAEPPSGTEIGIFGGFAGELGDAFGAAAAGGRRLYGFAEHSVASTFLGTSAGLRLRHDQQTGKVELNAKSADLTRSAWAGTGTLDFTDVDVAALEAGLAQRIGWAERRIELPAGRYETLLPPSAMADLMIYLYWSAGAKDALDGRSVFSKPGGGTRVGEPAADAAQQSRRAGPADRALRHRVCLQPGVVGLRQRPAAAADRLDLRRGPGRPDPDPAFGPAVRAGGNAADRKPDPAGTGRDCLARGHDRRDQARPAAHLPVVCPRG